MRAIAQAVLVAAASMPALAAVSGAPGGVPGDAGAAPPPQTMDLIDYIRAGGLLSYVMVVLSVVAVAMVLRNMWALRESRLTPPAVVAELDRLLREDRVEEAREFCARPESASFLASIFKEAIARCQKSPFGFLELRSAVEEVGQAEADRLHRLNDGLGIIAAVGPMLGLLGTVIGMIGAFQSIGVLEGAARSSELARFMSLALVNTAEGLIIAIPCTVAFAIFRRRIDRLVADAGRVVEDLAAHLASGEPGKEAAARGAGEAPAARPAAPAAPARAGAAAR